MMNVMEEPVAFQVQLERRQHRRLKALAARRGVSMGAVVRESVETYLRSISADDDPLLGIIGILGDDAGPRPHGDVATHVDEYLADALEAEWREATPKRGRTRTSPRQ
jgi:hypothetical protein